MQLQCYTTGGLSNEFESLFCSYPNAIFCGVEAEAAIVPLNALNGHHPWLIWDHLGNNSVSSTLASDESVFNSCCWVVPVLHVVPTSTAHPIQSKPGPRFATVAGAKAAMSLTTGSMRDLLEDAKHGPSRRAFPHGNGRQVDVGLEGHLQLCMRGSISRTFSGTCKYVPLNDSNSSTIQILIEST